MIGTNFSIAEIKKEELEAIGVGIYSELVGDEMESVFLQLDPVLLENVGC